SFTVNVETARQLLSALDIRDVTLPDALGTAPIQVEMAPSASTEYVGPGYALTLHQATSPSVTLPDGVDMAQLGYAALRVLGTAPEQAELLSRQINWNSTLLVPFPTDTNNLRQVTVNGEPALLMTNGPRNSQGGVIYWQQGGTIYILQGSNLSGMRDQEIADLLVRTAESVQ
ncbi:anti-sigma factor, partial [Kouleothrix aurantiaca]